MTSEISVLIADDHNVITDALSSFLELNTTLKVQTASNLDEAKAKIRNETFDIALVDFRMPGVSNSTFITQLHDEDPSIRVVVFSGQISDATALELVKAGAKGYVPKSMPASAIPVVIELILAGETFLPASVHEFEQKRRHTILNISPLETEIINLLAVGAVNKEIARDLSLSETSVKMHVRNIFKKLEVRNRTEAALKAKLLEITP